MDAGGHRTFLAHGGFALAAAHARYWTSVAPLVRKHLRRWEARARQIPDQRLRGLALEKLRAERFNAEVAAMIATIAPARHRERTVEAIVALQVMYDYLDALTEQPTADPIRDGLQHSKAFVDAVTVATEPTGSYYAYDTGLDDNDYLADLAAAVHGALAGLPAIGAIAPVIRVSATRCAEAQIRIHAAPHTGIEQLQRWAEHEARDTELQWREWLFGAMGSVVAAHALIALAADERATYVQARELDRTYLSLCVLTTVLDHLVDHERDMLAAEESYLHLYATHDDLTQQMSTVAHRVLERARTIPNGPHHAMILSGVVAYYTSQPSATGEFAGPATEHIRNQMKPLITPTLATMHAWRLAKRLHRSLQARWVTVYGEDTERS